ncbi:MAG TPA: DUF4276 family protein [Bryobacteraceae bacterium]|nr:DUF4276 family protein [Bryobacteraceae bacterium]
MVVEGQTEASFVESVLAAALWPNDIHLNAILLGVPGHKGGHPSYDRVRKDILLHLKQDRNVYCSTMLDLYGLGKGFPGAPVPPGLPGITKATRIEQAVKADICSAVPDLRPDIRFVPYIQVHEFEALLFSDPRLFAAAILQPRLERTFQAVRDGYATPEDINDGATTAPSKRVCEAFGSYRKVVHGATAATRIGVESMRRECPHFRSWIEQLSRLAQ